MSLLINGSFDPTGLYYSSVIQALDTHKVRVQSTESTSLANAFSLDKGSKVSNVSWGVSPNIQNNSSSTSTANKKRRLSNNFNIESQYINISTNKGSILIYNPLANQVIGTLENPNSVSIIDYQFSSLTNSGWSVDINQNIIQWDLLLFKPKQQFKFNEPINALRVIEYERKPHLLLASHSISLYDLQTNEVIKTFPGHISPIHSIVPLDNSSYFITAAHGDRFINIYSLDDSFSSVLVTQSDVLSISYNEKQVTAVTEDGIVEVFNDILTKPAQSNNRKKGQQSKQSNFKIELKRTNSSEQLKIDYAFIDQGFIKLSWLETGDIPYFYKVKIDDLSQEQTIIFREKPAIQAKDHSLYGQDIAAAKKYNEGNTVVTSGDNLKYLNNAEEEDIKDGPTLAEKLELLRVDNTLPKKKQGRATTGTLAVVLTQALRSNDHSLLETVLTNRDEKILKATIERLDTSLAIKLLERLAERISRQTNRQGQLNLWVKWIMVIHGGYLVNIPNLSTLLSSLHSTLVKRANTLNRLLELQGKLDVYYSNLDLDQDDDEFESEEDSDEEDVEYIEELDDASLIDNGEEDYDIDDNNEGEYEEEDAFIDVESEESSDEEQEILDEEEEALEEGFSDEEVGTARIDSDPKIDEQEDLKKRIATLKAKQSKLKR
ncbi:hypothetical protein WICMUC_002213 [Wickerhamomyces mucosus]|uniref:Small-subunit processome Utp12 domain-containing protein n=1 Tax=Wickerhamomyces mucosus TaxID=1378264 RepID=A0A9P8TF91_9ASCO|nr:hypothetical protein WICMUC_002213 [Wickerhamomyces mucosus]